MTDKQLSAEGLDFAIEDRSGCRVLVWSGNNGCRPATDAECVLRDRLTDAQRLVAQKDAEIAQLTQRIEAADEWATMASAQLEERDRLRARVAELEADVSKWKTLAVNSQRVAEIATSSHERMARLNAKPAGEVES